MANNRRKFERSGVRSSQVYYEYIEDGNAVRKIAVVPEFEEPEEYIQRPQTKTVHTKVHYERRMSVYGLKYTLFLIVSFAVFLGVCFGYMRASSDLTTARKTVSTLQSTLQGIQEQNSLLEEGLNTTIDLEEVYRIATEEFGMVSADESQVIYYSSSNSDYVRQYGKIPD